MFFTHFPLRWRACSEFDRRSMCTRRPGVRFARNFAVLIATGLPAVSRPQPNTDTAALLHRLVDSGSVPDLRWAKFSAEQTEVAKFYASRGYSLAWARDRAPTPQAEALIRILEGAGAKGLDPEDYDGSRWAGRLARLRPASPHPDNEDLARFDLALTDFGAAVRLRSARRQGKSQGFLLRLGHRAEGVRSSRSAQRTPGQRSECAGSNGTARTSIRRLPANRKSPRDLHSVGQGGRRRALASDQKTD